MSFVFDGMAFLFGFGKFSSDLVAASRSNVEKGLLLWLDIYMKRHLYSHLEQLRMSQSMECVTIYSVPIENSGLDPSMMLVAVKGC